MAVRSDGLVVNAASKTGKRQVTGSAALKPSQHYPLGFGRACAAVYARHRSELIRRAESGELALAAQGARFSVDDFLRAGDGCDAWADADLDQVVRFLRVRVLRNVRSG
eukprot:2110552-Alexandrium_andersonii.AAC.1